MRNWILLGLWCLLPVVGNGQVLVREDFETYAALNPLFCLDGRTDDGWTGPWVRTTGDDAIIRRGSLPLPDTTAGMGGRRGSLDFVRAGIRYDRPFELIQDDGQDLWVGILTDFYPGSAANNVGNLTLTRSGTQVFTVGRKFGNRRLGLVWPGETRPTSTVAAEGRHWLVVRIRFSGNSDPETIHFWVDPDPGGGPPPEETAVLAYPRDGFPGPRLNSGLNGAQLKVEGTPPLRTDFDALVLSRSFTDLAASVSTASRVLAPLELPLRCYPNPVAGPLTVEWQQPSPGRVTVDLLSADGRPVARLHAAEVGAGPQRLHTDLNRLNLPPGHYLLRLSTGQHLGTTALHLPPR